MFIGAIDAPVKKGELIQVERRGKKGQRKTKITLIEALKNDMSIQGITKIITIDRIE